MATWNAIAATTHAILELLADSCPREAFGEATFTAIRAAELAGGEAPPYGCTLCLHDVSVDHSLRNQSSRNESPADRKSPGLPLVLRYLLTAWGSDTDVEQRLLGWAMSQLNQAPVLSAAWLNRYPGARPAFRPDESVELSFEPLALAEHASVREFRLRTSVACRAHGVVIESQAPMTEGSRRAAELDA